MLAFGDVWLLAKKIGIGVVITVVPLGILTAGLWITQRAATIHEEQKPAASAKVGAYAN
jgi:hypothetical protein